MLIRKRTTSHTRECCCVYKSSPCFGKGRINFETARRGMAIRAPWVVDRTEASVIRSRASHWKSVSRRDRAGAVTRGRGTNWLYEPGGLEGLVASTAGSWYVAPAPRADSVTHNRSGCGPRSKAAKSLAVAVARYAARIRTNDQVPLPISERWDRGLRITFQWIYTSPKIHSSRFLP